MVVPIAFNLIFFMLQKTFEYPDILRKPTDEILRRFKQGGPPLRRLWYTFYVFGDPVHPGPRPRPPGVPARPALVPGGRHDPGRVGWPGAVPWADSLALLGILAEMYT